MIKHESLDAVRAYVSATAPLLNLRLDGELLEQVSVALAESLASANSFLKLSEDSSVQSDGPKHDR